MDTFFSILWSLYLFLQLFFSSFLLQPFILLCIHAGRKLFKRKQHVQAVSANPKRFQFGVIVTVHRDSRFIPSIVDSLLRQTYSHFNVYVVADDCQSDLPRFEDGRIHILRPDQPLNSNTKSIGYALRHFKAADEVMVIFDPDNLVHPRFLEVLNTYYNQGCEAVQANMQAKNADTLYEKIDSVGALFNNFIDREVRNELQLSVNTWGCGISLKKELYEKIRYDKRSVFGGFDKHLQAEMIKRIPRLAYAEEAIFYDEKISSAAGLEKQRTRWISAYFRFLPDAFTVTFSGIRRGDFNRAYFGYNLVRPPYFLQILIAILFICVNFFIEPAISLVWIGVLSLFLFSFAAVILMRQKNGSLLQGLWYAPLFFFHQLRALSKLKQNKNSILKTDNCKVLYIKDMFRHEEP